MDLSIQFSNSASEHMGLDPCGHEHYFRPWVYLLFFFFSSINSVPNMRHETFYVLVLFMMNYVFR